MGLSKRYYEDLYFSREPDEEFDNAEEEERAAWEDEGMTDQEAENEAVQAYGLDEMFAEDGYAPPDDGDDEEFPDMLPDSDDDAPF